MPRIERNQLRIPVFREGSEGVCEGYFTRPLDGYNWQTWRPVAWLYRALGWQTQEDASVVLAAKIHDQPIPVGDSLGVPVKALQGLGVKESVATAEIEQTVHCLETELCDERLVAAKSCPREGAERLASLALAQNLA